MKGAIYIFYLKKKGISLYYFYYTRDRSLFLLLKKILTKMYVRVNGKKKRG